MRLCSREEFLFVKGFRDRKIAELIEEVDILRRLRSGEPDSQHVIFYGRRLDDTSPERRPELINHYEKFVHMSVVRIKVLNEELNKMKVVSTKNPFGWLLTRRPKWFFGCKDHDELNNDVESIAKHRIGFLL